MPQNMTVSMLLIPILWVFMGCFGVDGESRFLEDHAEMLTTAQRHRIRNLNRQLLEELDIHFKAVILADSPADLNTTAVNVFDADRLGQETRGAKGLLFLVDPVGKAVRLEVGYDLEGIFTDAYVGYIERAQMAPFFESGKMAHGIEATCELLVAKALSAVETGAYRMDTDSPPVGEHLSGGGGADMAVEMWKGRPAKETTPHPDRFGPQPSPLLAMETYREILRQHIKDPNLGVYTPATRKFFAKWLVTDAQQDSELRELEKMVSKASIVEQGHLAVVRFPVTYRQTSPYLLRRDHGGWALDFAAMSRLIGFNHKNQWFFRTTDHSYAFAFRDLTFDKHGFPHKNQ